MEWLEGLDFLAMWVRLVRLENLSFMLGRIFLRWWRRIASVIMLARLGLVIGLVPILIRSI